jgi:nucleoside phosphorylase
LFDSGIMMVGLSVRLAVPCLILASFFVPVTRADVGIISFWVPELFVLLGEIEEAGNPIETYIFGARKFYVTKFKGHNVVAVNTGVGISNTAATVAILLQKFPTIDRIVGSGIAGGVVSIVSEC